MFFRLITALLFVFSVLSSSQRTFGADPMEQESLGRFRRVVRIPPQSVQPSVQGIPTGATSFQPGYGAGYMYWVNNPRFAAGTNN